MYKYEGEQYTGHYCPLCGKGFDTFMLLFLHSYLAHPDRVLVFRLDGLCIRVTEESGRPTYREGIPLQPLDKHNRKMLTLFLEIAQERLQFTKSQPEHPIAQKKRSRKTV